MDWITEPWIALAALGLSLLVAIAQAVSFFLLAPRAHWVLDSFIVEAPEAGTWGATIVGDRWARYTFRNAGTAAARLTEVQIKTPEGWRRYGERVNETFAPEGAFTVDVFGTLTQRADVPQVWSSGDGFWFKTDHLVRVTWSHRPSRLRLRLRRTLHLERDQQDAKIEIVAALSRT